MEFKEKDDGQYRIYAGSLELSGRGHMAGVIVYRFVNGIVNGRATRHEILRDMSISGGHRWKTSGEAIKHALQLGAEAVLAERARADGHKSVSLGSAVSADSTAPASTHTCIKVLELLSAAIRVDRATATQEPMG